MTTPRIATWADIRKGAVVRKPPGYDYTITGVGQTMALRMRHGREYVLHRESVDEGRHLLIREASE